MMPATSSPVTTARSSDGDIGTLYAPTGDFDESGVPVLEALQGYHVNGLWCGAEADLPAELSAFRVYPESPLRVWG